MIFEEIQYAIFDVCTFSQKAEKKLVGLLLDEGFVSDLQTKRRLASYPLADFPEKNRLILEITKTLSNEGLRAELIAVLREFDSMFGMLGRRGHFVHQFEVTLLGWAFIRLILNKGSDVYRIFRFNNDQDIFNAWLMVALGHDLGYPLEVAEQVMDRFCEIYKSLRIYEVADLYRKLREKCVVASAMSKLKREVSPFDVDAVLAEGIRESLNVGDGQLTRLMQTFKGRTHGYVSAIIMAAERLLPNVIGRQSLTDDELRLMKLVLPAVCMHDIDDSAYISEMSFDLNPFLYLLFLADNLQDWSRNLRPNEKWPSYTLLDIEKIQNEFKITYQLTHEKWNTDIEERTRRSINEKRTKIHLAKGPMTNIGLQLKVEFLSNLGSRFKPIEISF